MNNDELIAKTMLELSAASQRPIQKVVDTDTNESEQLLKARRSVARDLGIHAFRPVDRGIIARGPWTRNVFTRPIPTKNTAKSEAAKSDLVAEVNRLMKVHEARREQLKKAIERLLSE